MMPQIMLVVKLNLDAHPTLRNNRFDGSNQGIASFPRLRVGTMVRIPQIVKRANCRRARYMFPGADFSGWASDGALLRTYHRQEPNNR